MIKRLFGSYTKFVFFTKNALAIVAILLVLYIILIVKFGDDSNKIKLLNSNKKTEHPYLEILNSKISGIKFLSYKFEILSDSVEKNSHGVFFFKNLNTKIFSDKTTIRLTSPIADYDEINETAHLKEQVNFFHKDYKANVKEIFFDIKSDFISSIDKFTLISPSLHFESQTGFKTDKIDFTQINFTGPINISFHSKKSKLFSTSMTIFVNHKTKKLEKSYNSGEVQFKNDKFDIHSDKAIYNAFENNIIFEDNLTILSGGKILHGKRFIYDIATDNGKIEADHQKNKRVEIILDGSK